MGYKRTKCENWEQFLDKLGTSFMIKKAATISTPTVTIEGDGTKWSTTMQTKLQSTPLQFEFGKSGRHKTYYGTAGETTVLDKGDNVWEFVIKGEYGRGDVVENWVFSVAGIEMKLTYMGTKSTQ